MMILWYIVSGITLVFTVYHGQKMRNEMCQAKPQLMPEDGPYRSNPIHTHTSHPPIPKSKPIKQPRKPMSKKVQLSLSIMALCLFYSAMAIPIGFYWGAMSSALAFTVCVSAFVFATGALFSLCIIHDIK
jgi:hypothetical protein